MHRLPHLPAPLVLASSLLAACGPAAPTKAASTGPAATGTTTAGYDPVALWAPVMVEGATYKFDDSTGDPAASSTTVVTATVIKVTRDDGGVTAELTWIDDGGNDVAGGLPRFVRVAGANVWFGDSDTLDPDEVVSFPPPGDETRAGLYTHASSEGVCYGSEPADADAECEDVCFAELCLAPGRGLIGGAGTWWPGYAVYARRAAP